MPVEKHTFKQRRYECQQGHQTKAFKWDYDPHPPCATCGAPTSPEYGHRQRAHAVHGDEIDVVIENGPCWPDGTPRRYRSKSELNREAAALGWQRDGDTPHPERIDWARR